MLTDSPLDRNVQFLRGVGPERVLLLAKLGIHTVQDLLFWLPKDLLDLTLITPIVELVDGVQAQVRGRVVDIDARATKKGGTLVGIAVQAEGGYVRGLWFNQPWMKQKFRHNDFVVLAGKPKRKMGRWEFGSPHVQWLDPDDSNSQGAILPRYHLTEGLKMHEMRKIMRNAVEECADHLPDLLPEAFRAIEKLPAISAAIRMVHLPTSADLYKFGLRRLIHQDLLEFQLGIALRRRAWRRLSNAPRLPISSKVDARIRRLFPFSLTPGQNRAIDEICHDLDTGHAMHRLLQADVGAGKTVVAVYAILVAIAAGFQGVLMAPTEILAQQHWQTINNLLTQSRVERLLLTGSLTTSERRDAHERIRDGRAQLIVGTQSLIQKEVSFSKLGIVVIDEQHRFGVRQRARFASDGALPHTLVMTATPIPRSLCLTQFGDLDLSIVRDLPPGRQPVSTHRVPDGPLQGKAWEFIRKKIADGRQVYVVCPRIEGESPAEAAKRAEEAPDYHPPAAAEQVFEQLRTGELEGKRIALLHGRLPSDEKKQLMQNFREGQLDVLVSTTVIEVGVDVPNATILVVMDAERFGLAQLHQLRGRVGRGTFQGYCFLFSHATTEEANNRLVVMEKKASGFDVAEDDFRMRGPGDVLGSRQHGDLPLLMADLIRDEKLLVETREQAQQLVESGEFDSPPFAALKRRVLDRFGELMEITGGG